MIYLSIMGRLGNQMFQYAFARRLKELTGQKITIDFGYIDGFTQNGFSNSLSDFSVCEFIEVHDKNEYRCLKYMQPNQRWIVRNIMRVERILNSVYKKILTGNTECRFIIFQKIYSLILSQIGVFWFRHGYKNFEKYIKNNNDIFLLGYYESKEYFDDIRNILLEEFTPVHPEMPHNKELYDIIRSTESVCVSIRRGDFLFSNEHNVCSEQYFYNAVERISKSVLNPTFIIFSDDVDWVKQNMDFPCENIFYEKGDDPVWEKLRLMYSCKHFIISNSTFSWWAQYLSRNENKIVVSPERWFNSRYKSCLLEDSFIKIDVDKNT